MCTHLVWYTSVATLDPNVVSVQVVSSRTFQCVVATQSLLTVVFQVYVACKLQIM